MKLGSYQLYCSDIEADALLDEATKLWCMSNSELDDNMNLVRSFTLTKIDKIAEMFTNPKNILVMHNGIGFDGPVVAKILGIKVEAEIIDTLFLSWYLYPKMIKHGLQAWGEELGIAKPEIDDWENLTLKQYVHRCKEDVRIQVALWRQIWKHLMLLYGNEEGCWHVIRHLNFKAKCAAMQSKSRWKLDVPRCQQAEEDFGLMFEEAKEALEERMPKVPVYVTKTRPKKPFKANGDLSAHGQKWADLVEKEIDPEDYDYCDPVEYNKEIVIISKYKEPNAGSTQQLKAWLHSIGWVPESFKYVRNKETNEMRKIEQIKNPDTDELCESVIRLIEKEPALDYLREMSVVKHRLSIVKGFLANVDEEGYVRALVQGLTNTLRFKHKVCLNLPSSRKPYGELIRGLLTSANEETELCGSDMCSLEDRTKQHYMWPFDPEYVKEMQLPGFDPHLDMAVAAVMMTPDEVKRYKNFDKDIATQAEIDNHTAQGLIRHAGKSTNYAATYGAGGPAIARAAGVPEVIGNKLHEAYWKRNWSLNAIADSCIVKSSRGEKWLWNPVAKIWMWLKNEKDRFSTLNQSTGTYCFDRWLFHIIKMRPQLTAQFHDEGIWEIKKGNREAMTKILKIAIAKVNEELKLNRQLDCDVAFGNNYSEIH